MRAHKVRPYDCAHAVRACRAHVCAALHIVGEHKVRPYSSPLQPVPYSLFAFPFSPFPFPVPPPYLPQVHNRVSRMLRRTFLDGTARTVVGFGILGFAGGCRAGPDRSQEETDDARFSQLRDRYFLQTLEYNPVTATYLGGDGYSPTLAGINGRLRDYSPAALDLERGLYRQIERDLKAIDVGKLSSPERIDHAVLAAQLSFLLHQLDDLKYYQRSVDTYVSEPFRGVDWQIQQMQELDGGLLGSEAEWELVIARLEEVPRYLETARANLTAGKTDGNLPDHRMIARDGIQASESNVAYFRGTLPETVKGYLGTRSFAPRALDRVSVAATAAADAFQGFGAFLRGAYDPGEGSDRFAVGEKEYAWRVKNCLQDGRSAGELYQYGAEQVGAFEQKLFEVAGEVAREAKLRLRFGSDAANRAAVRRLMEHLSKDSPKNDDELFRWFRETGERLVTYGRERDLFDIPETYRLNIVPTPPVLRSTLDAAYYTAPPFKQAGVGRFYLTPTGNDPAALRLNNRASVADLAAHEGFPGHDWHYKFMTQHAREISNIRWLTPGSVEDSSSMWQDSMASEGWALYAEELIADPAPERPHGFYTAAEYLYELQGQLLRAVRVRVDVGIHTGRMSFAEAKDYFTEHVSFYPAACARAQRRGDARAICDEAERAIYRYSKWPTQAITYNLGKTAILDLRNRYLQASSASSASPATPATRLKAFHEKFMKMGTIPANYFAGEFVAART